MSKARATCILHYCSTAVYLAKIQVIKFNIDDRTNTERSETVKQENTQTPIRDVRIVKL